MSGGGVTNKNVRDFCLVRIIMKSFRTIEKGRDVYRFIRIPKEYSDMGLEIKIKPVKKSVTKFSHTGKEKFPHCDICGLA